MCNVLVTPWSHIVKSAAALQPPLKFLVNQAKWNANQNYWLVSALNCPPNRFLESKSRFGRARCSSFTSFKSTWRTWNSVWCLPIQFASVPNWFEEGGLSQFWLAVRPFLEFHANSAMWPGAALQADFSSPNERNSLLILGPNQLFSPIITVITRATI